MNNIRDIQQKKFESMMASAIKEDAEDRFFAAAALLAKMARQFVEKLDLSADPINLLHQAIDEVQEEGD